MIRVVMIKRFLNDTVGANAGKRTGLRGSHQKKSKLTSERVWRGFEQ
jgi:hypothetical protein